MRALTTLAVALVGAGLGGAGLGGAGLGGPGRSRRPTLQRPPSSPLCASPRGPGSSWTSEGPTPDLAADLRRELRRPRPRPRHRPARRPLGWQLDRHLQLAGPRHNHGQDWYFTNFADCWSAAFDYCQRSQDYSAADAHVQQDRSTGTATLLTLPLLGWVANGVSYAGHHPCSYPAAANPQDDHDPYHSVCGNGRRNGQWLAADPTTAGVAVGPAFSAQWIDALKSKYGDARHGGVSIYELGNEPALWDSTHHDFHPQPTTYDELWAKSRDLAVAVKDADPGAEILGPAEWGWPNYFCSAADDVDQGCSAASPDRAAHGGTELSAWYLQQFAAYQQQTGRRLLDYFDLHYYPQGHYSPTTDVTRSLWDPSYTDPSWIGARIALLPRMRGWVRGSFPGTKLAISEYNLGLGVTSDSRLQNVIEADALGIFGREGLDLATFWPDGLAGPCRGVADLPQLRRTPPRLRRHRRLGEQLRPEPGLGLRCARRHARPADHRRGQQGEDRAADRRAAQARARRPQGEGVAVRRGRHPQARWLPGPPPCHPAHRARHLDHPDPGPAGGLRTPGIG